MLHDATTDLIARLRAPRKAAFFHMEDPLCIEAARELARLYGTPMPNDTTRPLTDEQWMHWQKLVSDEHDRQVAENDRLRALIGAQDTHNCEHDGCMQSELGGDGYRAEAKVWVDKYYAMKRRLIELGEPVQ
jgi:hypothetical protein